MFKVYLLYLSCHVKSSSRSATNSPLGNLLASFKKFVSIVTMCVSRSTSFCLRFSISTCRWTSWSVARHLLQVQPHSWKIRLKIGKTRHSLMYHLLYTLPYWRFIFKIATRRLCKWCVGEQKALTDKKQFNTKLENFTTFSTEEFRAYLLRNL